MSCCEFAHDDGAYVLGALSPADRAAYERHLAGCPACREAVAEIAVLPGLLGRLDPAALDELLPPPPDPTRLPVLLDAARDHRRRERSATRRRYALTALAAAVLAVLLGVGTAGVLRPVAPGGPPGQAAPAPSTGSTGSTIRLAAMRPVAATSRVHAEVGLLGTEWGTEVTMHCWYDDDADYHKAYGFRLVAHGSDGTAEQMASWLAGPGDDLRLTGGSRFTDAELTRLDLIRADGTLVLTYTVR
ncbi:anti-sigma factor family protein [Micromonospora sp. NPDC000089]|uniref:anti-sigma factor family protein n=1 Tax=unclassified Micromonospora TaxID=2617518 RepID=UPI00368B554F